MQTVRNRPFSRLVEEAEGGVYRFLNSLIDFLIELILDSCNSPMRGVLVVEDAWLQLCTCGEFATEHSLGKWTALDEGLWWCGAWLDGSSYNHCLDRCFGRFSRFEGVRRILELETVGYQLLQIQASFVEHLEGLMHLCLHA